MALIVLFPILTNIIIYSSTESHAFHSYFCIRLDPRHCRALRKVTLRLHEKVYIEQKKHDPTKNDEVCVLDSMCTGNFWDSAKVNGSVEYSSGLYKRDSNITSYLPTRIQNTTLVHPKSRNMRMNYAHTLNWLQNYNIGLDRIFFAS